MTSTTHPRHHDGLNPPSRKAPSETSQPCLFELAAGLAPVPRTSATSSHLGPSAEKEVGRSTGGRT